MRLLLLTFLAFFVVAYNSIAQPTSFVSRGVGGGGALFFPKINPVNDNEFYVTCDMSELFHSTDFGASYSQLHFSKLPVLNVSTYEYTNNVNVAYCNHNDGNNGYPVKTTDGGSTWVALPGYDANQGMVYRMTANYNNPMQLLMNYYGRIVISNDGDSTFQLVKQATNNGVGLIMGGAFFDGSNIYIGTNEGLLTSSNGGSSFTTMTTTGIPAAQVIWHFSAAKSGAITRFVCITGASAGTYNGIMPWDYSGFAKGVYTMDNANGTWQSKSAGITFTNDYVMYTGMAWNDVSTIYLAGHDAAAAAPLIYKSTDAGTTWAKVFKTANNLNIQTGWSGQGGDKQWSWGETAFGIAVAPNNSSKILFGDYSFIHTSSDGGSGWKQAYVATVDQHPANAATPAHAYYHSVGLENTTCWQVDWQSATSMIGCFSDIGGIRSPDAGGTWGFTANGMSVNSVYRIAKNPSGTLFAATSGIHDMYQSTRLKDAQLDASDANGKIMYSTDNGANWSLLHSFGHPVFWLATDPTNANRMYASVIHYGGGGAGSQGGIWMTSDLNNLATSTWTKLANPPRTEGHPASIEVLKDGKVVCTFSGRITAAGAFTASAGVFIYDPATSQWADVSDVNMQYWTKDVIIDPSDTTQNTWYACVFTGWGASAGGGKGGLYKTTNRGVSWTKLTATQFDRVTSITFNPQNKLQAYLTTETQGLWMSNDMNAATPAWTLVSSYPFRQPERVFFNPYNLNEIWVSSFGNGMRMGTVSTTNSVAEGSVQSSSLKVYPNPVNSVLHVTLPNIKKGEAITIKNINGQVVKTMGSVQSNSVDIDVHSWVKGVYFVQYANEIIKLIVE